MCEARLLTPNASASSRGLQTHHASKPTPVPRISHGSILAGCFFPTGCFFKKIPYPGRSLARVDGMDEAIKADAAAEDIDRAGVAIKGDTAPGVTSPAVASLPKIGKIRFPSPTAAPEEGSSASTSGGRGGTTAQGPSPIPAHRPASPSPSHLLYHAASVWGAAVGGATYPTLRAVVISGPMRSRQRWRHRPRRHRLAGILWARFMATFTRM
jgi:hypothetical protein